MEVQSKPDRKTATDKLKIEPFRLVVKTNLKDAPIFEMENEAEENKRRQRRLVELKSTLSQEEEKKKGIVGDAVRTVDSCESRDLDVLEVNAVHDRSIEEDLDDVAVVALGEEEGGTGEEQKHHKKHKKHEKKKKRRKEKANDDDRRDKHQKKHHRRDRSRSKDRSPSRSSSSTRRHLSSSDCRQSRDRSSNRSRERHHRDNSSGREWRYSPSRFDSHRRSHSRSRSPAGNLSHRRRRDRSPQAESARKRNLSTSTSPDIKADTKKHRSPRKKSPRAKSPRAKSPRTKSSRGKSPRTKSPRNKSPRNKSPRNNSPRKKSPRKKSPRSKSPRVKSPRKKSPKAKSPTKKSSSKSPLISSSRRRSSSETASVAEAKPRVDSSGNELLGVPSRGSSDSVIIIETPLSKKSPRKSPHKSPIKSPRVLSKDSSQPVSVVVPCAIQDEEPVAAPAMKKPGSDAGVGEEKVYVGITNASSVKKKAKSKKKAKKGDEEKKKKKKSAAKPDVADAVRNSDDELEDLLFTKTNKETKFEAVFHDSEIVSAKHDVRAVVVDVEPRSLIADVERRATVVDVETRAGVFDVVPRTESGEGRYPVCQEISPAASPLANTASESYKPEEPTDEGSNDFAPLEPPPRPPAILGFFPSIPFLTEKQQQQQVDNGPQQLIQNNSGDAVYSPIETLTPVDSPNLNTSPGKPSPVHLSDISRRESSVENTVGVITPAEKIEDFLDRMPGSFTQPDASEVVDMDMSPTNGINATFQSSEDDDDIIEQLHKEFVRSQNEVDKVPAAALDNSGIWGNIGNWGSDSYEPTVSLSPALNPVEDPIVVAFKTKGRRKHRGKKHKTRKEKKLLPLAKEKKDIEEALNRVHRQARVEDEMKHVLKAYFKHNDITKDEYKMILRKAVPQVANSDHGIDPERIRSLAKKYVAKYKGIRLRDTKTLDKSLADQVYSPTSQDMAVAFSP